MLKTLKEFTSVAQAEVESLKLFYASVVSSLLFKFLYEVHNACISNFCCVQENNTVLQGRNADALALYFGEDPQKCPFEQGKIYWKAFILFYFSLYFKYLVKQVLGKIFC